MKTIEIDDSTYEKLVMISRVFLNGSDTTDPAKSAINFMMGYVANSWDGVWVIVFPGKVKND